MNQELAHRIEKHRADYEEVTGNTFKHFFCPILHVDDDVALCRGHVLNDALGNSGIWVPQREDIDNFYGSVAEADMIDVVELRETDLLDIFSDPDLRKRVPIKLECDGQIWDHYFPRVTTPVDGQSILQMKNEDTISHIAVKVSEAEVLAAADKSLNLAIDRDYRPPVIASVLKAAHLSMFKMLGYNYVFSPAGKYVADILRKFFLQFKTPRNVTQTDIDNYFIQFTNMVHPIVADDRNLAGTVKDSRVVACYSAHDVAFAFGVIVPAGEDCFSAFLPTDHGIDTYFSFIKDLPPSFAGRITQFCPANAEHAAHWAIAPGEPMRLPLNQDMPRRVRKA